MTSDTHGAWTVLHPAPGQCQTCARQHAPALPHDQRSLFYQMTFSQAHGRLPTWKDAMQHCTPETQAAWKIALVTTGVLTKPEDWEPTP